MRTATCEHIQPFVWTIFSQANHCGWVAVFYPFAFPRGPMEVSFEYPPTPGVTLPLMHPLECVFRGVQKW